MKLLIIIFIFFNYINSIEYTKCKILEHNVNTLNINDKEYYLAYFTGIISNENYNIYLYENFNNNLYLNKNNAFTSLKNYKINNTYNCYIDDDFVYIYNKNTNMADIEYLEDIEYVEIIENNKDIKDLKNIEDIIYLEINYLDNTDIYIMVVKFISTLIIFISILCIQYNYYNTVLFSLILIIMKILSLDIKSYLQVFACIIILIKLIIIKI